MLAWQREHMCMRAELARVYVLQYALANSSRLWAHALVNDRVRMLKLQHQGRMGSVHSSGAMSQEERASASRDGSAGEEGGISHWW